MIKKIAWDTFKNTGDINSFLEFKQIEDLEKSMQNRKNGVLIQNQVQNSENDILLQNQMVNGINKSNKEE